MSATRDSLDLRILALLQHDPPLTADALARKLPLSASAVVQVQMDRHALAAVEALRRRPTASPHVQLSSTFRGPSTCCCW